MIGRLHGLLVFKQPPYLMIDVGGVGYELEASLSTFAQLAEVGSMVTLYTHLSIRDDAHTLYGFSTLAERALFRSVTKVNGVGAKLALLILSGMNVELFSRCVQDSDTTSLTKLPGIGKKTAEHTNIRTRQYANISVYQYTNIPGSMIVQTDPIFSRHACPLHHHVERA